VPQDPHGTEFAYNTEAVHPGPARSGMAIAGKNRERTRSGAEVAAVNLFASRWMRRLPFRANFSGVGSAAAGGWTSDIRASVSWPSA
jgi:hypothetical protein